MTAIVQANLAQLAKQLRCNLFADRENFNYALSCAYGLIATLPEKHRATAFTALHVVLNTIANEIDPKE